MLYLYEKPEPQLRANWNRQFLGLSGHSVCSEFSQQ